MQPLKISHTKDLRITKLPHLLQGNVKIPKYIFWQVLGLNLRRCLPVQSVVEGKISQNALALKDFPLAVKIPPHAKKSLN